MASLLFPAISLDHHYYNDKLQFCEGKFSSSFQRVIVTIVSFFELWSSRHWMTILQKSLQYSVSCPVFLFSLSPTLSSLTLALLFTQWWNTNTLIRRRTLIPLPSSPSPRSLLPPPALTLHILICMHLFTSSSHLFLIEKPHSLMVRFYKDEKRGCKIHR